MDALFDVFESLPRCAPGTDDATQRALATCIDAPDTPRIIDLGCGPGSSAIPLAQSGAHVTAVDLHVPFVAEVTRRAESAGVAHRVDARVGDMGNLPYDDGAFDIVWSEGAAYCIGVARAVAEWQRLVEPGGYLVVSDLCWRVEDPCDEVRAHWANDYPDMGGGPQFEARVHAAGWNLVDAFWLPKSGWDAYYDPQRVAVPRVRIEHPTPEAQAVLDQLDREIAVFDAYGDTYGYYLLVAQRPFGG
jgi:SAM-dependent methyltransferase